MSYDNSNDFNSRREGELGNRDTSFQQGGLSGQNPNDFSGSTGGYGSSNTDTYNSSTTGTTGTTGNYDSTTGRDTNTGYGSSDNSYGRDNTTTTGYGNNDSYGSKAPTTRDEYNSGTGLQRNAGDNYSSTNTGSGVTGTGATGTGYGNDRFDDNNRTTGTDSYGSGRDTYGSSDRDNFDSNTTGNKPSMGDKVKGTVEVMTGKLTGNHAKVETGRERKAGEFDNTNTGTYGDNNTSSY